MRQVEIDLCDWDITGTADEDRHSSSIMMESRKQGIIMQTQLSSSSKESGIYCLDERSTPSPDSSEDNRERNQSIDESNPNFLTLQLDHSFSRRKISTCSDTSSIDSAGLSLEGSSDSDRNSTSYCDTVSSGSDKFDEIIDKIVELRFSKNVNKSEGNQLERCSKETTINKSISIGSEEKNIDANDVNGNYTRSKKIDDNEYRVDERIKDDDDSSNYEEDDDDLVERGPVRPPFNTQPRHGKPYYTLDWLTGTSANIPQNQSYTSVYDSTAEQILRNKQFSEKINPCLDKLSDYGQSNRSYSNIAEQTTHSNHNNDNGWASPDATYTNNGTPNSNTSGEDVITGPIPSIVLNDPGEASLLEILANGGFQAAQAPSSSDTGSNQNPSPSGASLENWPDSPTSSCNVLSPRSHSRASSRAQSPGSGGNIGSPQQHLNVGGSPSEAYRTRQNFRAGRTLSSSESSSYSYGDTPSPANYQCALDSSVEERLGLDFGSFSTWCQSCVSSGTIVNSGEDIGAAFDSNELQLVEEVIRRDQSEKKSKMDDMQVVPKSQSLNCKYDNFSRRVNENDLVPTSTTIKRNCGQILNNIENVFDEPLAQCQGPCKNITTGQRSCPPPSNNQFYVANDIPELSNIGVLMTTAQNNIVYPDLDDVYNLTYSDDMQSNVYNENPLNSAESLMDFENSMENFLASHYHGTPPNINNSTSNHSSHIAAPVNPVPQRNQLNNLPQINVNCDTDNWRERTEENVQSTFNNFQMPETVSSYRQNRSRRTSERSIAPWPSLNLPQTDASERLKADLDPKEVEKAMINLLKKPTEELAAADDDGDTMLMCLVGNPSELERKKAYLAPLVERLGNLSGALTMTNNRSEDALYLAAISCPQISYVTGYLAASMLQRGIDISQRLYNTRGDTLIHAVASKGDSHGAVLAELLSLRTAQGNAIFDLSKRNYDGRTPLHVAVESNGRTVSGTSSIGTIRLLLENGANPTIKETKCGDTALHIAVSLCSDPAIVKALLNNNGHEAVNIPNYNNNSPVHMAAALSNDVPIERHMDICMQLVNAGGITNIPNRQGKTPVALVSPDRKNSMRHIFTKRR